MRVNLGQTKTATAGGFSPLPDGSYLCRVVSAEDSADGRQVALEFVVALGEHRGRKLWDRLFATPKALPRLKLAVEAMGFDCDGDIELNNESLSGRYVMLTLESEWYEGKQRNKVTFSGYRAPTDEECAAAEAARVADPATRQSARNQAAQTTGANDEAVPF